MRGFWRLSLTAGTLVTLWRGPHSSLSERCPLLAEKSLAGVWAWENNKTQSFNAPDLLSITTTTTPNPEPTRRQQSTGYLERMDPIRSQADFQSLGLGAVSPWLPAKSLTDYKFITWMKMLAPGNLFSS